MTITTLSHFDRELKRLRKKYPSIGQDLKVLVSDLETNPTQGDALGKDCYKIRMAISSKNKGKSGGARVITCVKVIDDVITLLSIYDKSEQSDIPNALLQQLLAANGLL